MGFIDAGALSLVSIAIALLAEGLAAEAAAERLHVEVRAHVVNAIPLLGEGTRAKLALELHVQSACCLVAFLTSNQESAKPAHLLRLHNRRLGRYELSSLLS